jgi:hypothetical protein
MRGSPESLAALRLLLAERFPQAAPRPAAVLPTGVAAIDDVAGGGLPVGGITEVVALAPSSGGQLLISSLLAATRARRMRAVLVDARDAFDPQSHEPLLLQHLIWVRCRTLDEAMHAADILVRDANMALVMVDLRGLEWRALRGVPATTWYRLQRVLERTDMALVVLTTGEIENRKSEIGNGNHSPPTNSDLFRNVEPDLASGPNGHVEGAAPSAPIELGRWANRPLGNGPPASPFDKLRAPSLSRGGDPTQSGNEGFIGSARLRLNLASAFALPAFDVEQPRLASRLPAEVQRSRVHEERRIA